jgi:hypothetical protein
MISVEKTRPSVPFPVLDMRDLGDAAEGDSHYNPNIRKPVGLVTPLSAPCKN